MGINPIPREAVGDWNEELQQRSHCGPLNLPHSVIPEEHKLNSSQFHMCALVVGDSGAALCKLLIWGLWAAKNSCLPLVGEKITQVSQLDDTGTKSRGQMTWLLINIPNFY